MGKIKLKKEKKVKEGVEEVRVEKKSDQNSSVIRLSHVPHGFYEQEMSGYFKQFGTVQRVRLLRNNKVSLFVCG
jgi:nucleolar protein 15